MKNYYELLEVSQKASKEVIDKAYRVLIKKYHPDTHSPSLKKKYEERLKEINEAYEVLSNEFMKEQYDKELQIEKQKKYEKQVQELKKESDKVKYSKLEEINNKKYNSNVQDIDNGLVGIIRLLFSKREIVEKRRKDKDEIKRDIMALLLTILVIIVVLLVLYSLPFTHDWINKNFIQNPLLQRLI